MKIEKYGSVMSAYMKNTYEPTGKKQRAAAGKNVDKAVFSSASGALNGMKASAARSVESFASPERIAELKAMIADGSYNISAETVAASILEE
ncbi:MAG: flagellar biosynthesis anti-sigma factor FlgM [Ruminococcus sp.]|nr:flagellar biosynthesis anti-sigma factor FlgM [Ruminococcus sp.]